MTLLSGSAIRKLIPALAVGAVLAFSFMAQTPSLASSTNNCGVKGYGYHDHGKPCPNRPFPGHGNGVERILNGGTTVSSETGSSQGSPKNKTTSDNSSSAAGIEDSDTSDSQSQKGHGKGHAHVHGHGNGKPASS